MGRRLTGPAVFGGYLALSGLARLLVETMRINDPVLFGLTQPQLWSIVSIAAGVVIVVRASERFAAGVDAADSAPAPSPEHVRLD